MAEYKLAHLDEIEELEGRTKFRPIRHHFGISTFGINANTAAAAGDPVVPEHAEDEPGSSEELYIVTAGDATFELDGETRDAPAGTFVYVEPGVKRSAVARTPGTTVLAIGGAAPGEAYKVSGWELFSPMMRLFQAGDYEAAADQANALLDMQEQPAGELYYNTACAEGLCGRTDAALAHLKRALELMPSLAELARTDSDLDPLRAEPGFSQLVDDVST
jgi:hypothetical protein